MSNKLVSQSKLPLFHSPLHQMHNIFSRMDELFDFSNDINYHSNIIEVAVPGYTDKDLSIHIEDGVVTVKGERKTEFSSASISKSFTVPSNCDSNKIDAKLENGLLTLTFEKLQKPEVKEIPINSK